MLRARCSVVPLEILVADSDPVQRLAIVTLPHKSEPVDCILLVGKVVAGINGCRIVEVGLGVEQPDSELEVDRIGHLVAKD